MVMAGWLLRLTSTINSYQTTWAAQDGGPEGREHMGEQQLPTRGGVQGGRA